MGGCRGQAPGGPGKGQEATRRAGGDADSACRRMRSLGKCAGGLPGSTHHPAPAPGFSAPTQRPGVATELSKSG